MNACLLDTCAVIDLIEESEEVTEAIATYDDFLVSQVVLGELIFGCYRSSDPKRELSRVWEWVRDDSIVTGNTETAEVYGKLAAELESLGRRIPQNDVWIAALCLQTGFPLVSSDKHFSRVPGLTLIEYRA